MPPLSRGKVTVPTGCGAFPAQFSNRRTQINRDPAVAKAAALARYANVVHVTIAQKGGHFPALEQPQAWMDDLRAFVRRIPPS
jgi:pimeloyl-ACP methyl ester carboxylesterase